VGKFRVLLESVKGVKSVVEYSAARGFFDFALRPAQKDGALAKSLKALTPEDLTITVLEAPAADEEGGRAPSVAVNLTAKEIAPAAAEEAHSARP
jgi:hypothetical protein